MGIVDNSMLVSVTMSVWSGRKLDRQVSEEIDVVKSTRTRAGNYNKNLFAGVVELESVIAVSKAIRFWHNRQTLPWSDGGERLLPLQNFLSYKKELVLWEQKFRETVEVFCTQYPTLIAAQAFQMGALFNRDEYPSPDKIAHKFDLRYTFSPVPGVQDWRIQTDDTLRQELENQYKEAYAERLSGVANDLWERLHGCLTHMSQKLDDPDENKRKVIRESLLGNAIELCGLLSRLNVLNDPSLEAARKQLESTLAGLDVKDLRKSEGARKEIKAQVDDILSRFSF
jgi:hypothetical protein